MEKDHREPADPRNIYVRGRGAPKKSRGTSHWTTKPDEIIIGAIYCLTCGTKTRHSSPPRKTNDRGQFRVVYCTQCFRKAYIDVWQFPQWA